MGDIRFHSKGLSSEVDVSAQRTVIPVYDFGEKTSPCRVACPAGHDIAWALNLVRSGQFTAALELFCQESPFPAITGRVCYHPCEPVCNRAQHDHPLAINMIERAMADHGQTPTVRPLARHPEHVAVVGSGPAGLTVAYHLAWLGYRVTVYEKRSAVGGVLRYGIPPYRLPRHLVGREADRLEEMGIAFRTGVAVGSDLTFETLVAEHDAVFIGVGLSAARPLPLAGIERVSAMAGLDFLYRASEGLLSQLEGRVLVIGGGDVAIDVSRTAKRLGAEAVSVYCLEDHDHMPAHPDEIRAAEQEQIRLHPAWAPVELEADGNGMVVGMQGVERLESGRPVLNGQRTAVRCHHIVYAIGQRLDAPWLPADWLVNGILRTNAVGRTVYPQVFAAGDIAGSYNVVQAIGGAKRAAVGIDCFLRGRDWRAWLPRVTLGAAAAQAISMHAYHQLIAGQDPPRMRHTVSYSAINADYFPVRDRLPRPHLPADTRSDFAEVNTTVPENVAVQEAARCFHCGECTVCGNCFIYCPDSAVVQREDGFFAINMQCKGCGQCVEECPRAAMSMVVDHGGA
ncbi:MAG: FAD-dependent oxidoreductase [Candidatus Binatia bacterium]